MEKFGLSVCSEALQGEQGSDNSKLEGEIYLRRGDVGVELGKEEKVTW